MELKEYINIATFKSIVTEKVNRNVLGMDSSIKIDDTTAKTLNAMLSLSTEFIQEMKNPDIIPISVETLTNMYAIELKNTLEISAFAPLRNNIDIDMTNFEVLSRAIEYMNDILLQLPLGAYAICNGAVGAFLMDSKYFKTSIENINMTTSMYYIGSIHSIKIYVDPFMKWTDKKLITVNKNFWNWEVSSDIIENLIIEENTFRPKFTIGDILQEINDVKHTVYNIVGKDFF